jgi:hypothetical protein
MLLLEAGLTLAKKDSGARQYERRLEEDLPAREVGGTGGESTRVQYLF